MEYRIISGLLAKYGSCIRTQMKPCACSPFPSVIATEFERHSHHTAFHSTTQKPFVPFQRCHAHQTYNRPAKCDETTPYRTEASATRHWTRAAPGRITRSRLLLAPYCTQDRKTLHKTGYDSVLFADAKASYFVRPETHNQSRL